MNHVMYQYYKMSVWVTRFAYLNLLWAFFSIAGLVVLGFMPATIGLFTVVRKWVQGEADIPIWSTFWRAFRLEFFKGNLLGSILFLIGYLLVFELHILQNQTYLAYILASFGVFGLMLIFVIILLYILPVYVHFNLRLLQYVKWSFIIGIAHPILTIVLLMVIFLVNYLMLEILPSLVFIFGGSITAYILTWGVSKAFAKVILMPPTRN